MPSSQQRIQVLLRPKVLELVKDLAAEEGLTNSKMVAQLVEEALANRGTFDKGSTSSAANATDSVDLKATLLSKVSESAEAFDEDDLKLLKKIQMMKKLGLF